MKTVKVLDLKCCWFKSTTNEKMINNLNINFQDCIKNNIGIYSGTILYTVVIENTGFELRKPKVVKIANIARTLWKDYIIILS